jgi:hypothetical protein
VEPTAAFAQLQLGFVDQTQWRYEVIRPLVLFADHTASQRARETGTHPDTVRTLQRRFRQQGMLGLLPSDVEVVHRRRASSIPAAVRQEVDRLKALYDGFRYRELAHILWVIVVFDTAGEVRNTHDSGAACAGNRSSSADSPLPK